MARGVLLYVGVHVDVYPLTCAELRKRYRDAPVSFFSLLRAHAAGKRGPRKGARGQTGLDR